jgi:hypothetical protein
MMASPLLLGSIATQRIKRRRTRAGAIRLNILMEIKMIQKEMPEMGEDDEYNFTEEETEQQDFVDNKIHELLNTLADSCASDEYFKKFPDYAKDGAPDSDLIEWNIEYIHRIVDEVQAIFVDELKLCTENQFYPARLINDMEEPEPTVESFQKDIENFLEHLWCAKASKHDLKTRDFAPDQQCRYKNALHEIAILMMQWKEQNAEPTKPDQSNKPKKKTFTVQRFGLDDETDIKATTEQEAIELYRTKRHLTDDILNSEPTHLRAIEIQF